MAGSGRREKGIIIEWRQSLANLGIKIDGYWYYF
mgnify:CR=1 FL=1